MIRVLQDKRFFSLFLIALIFSLSKSAFATTYVTPTDDQLVIGSRAIVRGRVLAVESAFDSQTGRVWTYTTLRINEVLKGDITQRKITIKEEGGQTAERGSIIYGTPQFKLNEQVILYLDSWGDGSLRVHDMFLGKFTISTDAQSGLQYAQRSLTDVNVVNVQSLGANISAESTEKMELSAYLQLVRNKVTANVEQSRAYEEAYYSLVPKLAEPPEFRDLKQQGRVEPQWTYISGAHPRWFEPDDNQPVVFMVNPSGAPNQQIMSDISAAMNAWSTVPGCGLRVTNGGSTTDCGPTDTSNNIVFNNCDGRWSGGGCQSILALGGLSWFPGQTRIINGVTFVRASAGFISFNPFAACNFGNSCNVQEITTHELGHALGLGHSADTTATMYGIAHFDGRCASTRQDDRDGITFIYPGTGGGGGQLSITTTSLPNGTLGAAYTQTLLATGGTLPYTWTLVSGALPAGLTLNSNGTISGTPTATTTANFTVQVRDAAQATAQKALTITIGTTASQYDSQFVSQTVPTSVQPGQQFNVNVKFLNTGTQPWATGSTFNFYLASQNPALNQTWGGNGVSISDFPTSPGQQLDLTFGVTAPIAAGTYNFQWQLYQNGGVGFFGQMSQNVVVQVGSGGGTTTNNATFVSQTVPTSMTTGQSYSVSVTMQNTGTTTWTPNTYKLGTQNPQDNTTWGSNRATLQNSVAPSANATFTLNITAPLTPGTYNFQWQMVQEGVGYFGTASTNVVVTVSAAGGSTNNAQYMSQSAPSQVEVGQRFHHLVTLKNTGTSTWQIQNGFRVGTKNPGDNTVWGRDRYEIQQAVAPNATTTLDLLIIAPEVAGTYNLQWQMVQGLNPGTYFGDLTPNLSITVVPAAIDSDNDGIPNTLEAVDGRDPAVRDNDIFSDTATGRQLFIKQMYRDFLGREADASGLSYWVNELNTNTRAQVIARFFTAPEFYVKTAVVTKMYDVCFRRIPDYEGIRYWLNVAATNCGSGNPTIACIEPIANSFLGSNEFVSTYGTLTNQQFITLLYQNSVNRAPTTTEMNQRLAQLTTEGRSRGYVLADLAANFTEYNDVVTNKVQVIEMYLVLLRRPPTTAEYNTWAGIWSTATTEDLRTQRRIQMAQAALGGTDTTMTFPYIYRRRFLNN
jgi:hypothetical protein